MFYVFAVTFSLGYGGVTATTSPLVEKLLCLTAHGAILGLVLAIGIIGDAVDPVLAGSIFDLPPSY